MSYIDILKKQLPIDEGRRLQPYRDTVGKLTIGVGHNLDDKPLSHRAVDVILEDDIADAEEEARRLFPNFDSLSDARKAVVVNMAFNLGDRLGQFRQTIAMIIAGRFEAAAKEMLDSEWAKQVGDRAYRLSEAMRNG